MTRDLLALPKGDLRLLETPLARTLLESTIPARLAHLARDGTPRITPTWFHWTGSELVSRRSSPPHMSRSRPGVSATSPPSRRSP